MVARHAIDASLFKLVARVQADAEERRSGTVEQIWSGEHGVDGDATLEVCGGGEKAQHQIGARHAIEYEPRIGE
jgi:hypothetical protein